MERTTWTDERLDDMSAEVRELRREMRSGFETTNRRIDGLGSDLRSEMNNGFSELRGELAAFRLTMLRLGGGMVVAFVGAIAAILARGV